MSTVQLQPDAVRGGMRLPRPRGPLSRQVVDALRTDHDVPALGSVLLDPRTSVFEDEDVQLALWLLYEQSYRGFADAHDHEWDPALVALRRRLETAFEDELRAATAPALHDARSAGPDLGDQLEHLVEHAPGPSLARFLHREATREEVLAFLRQRSLYHLKESDPHAFVVGRIDGRAKVALVELQYDEFGGGRLDRLHSRLYADALRAAGLDDTYGAHVEETTATTLAVNNVMSLFGLNHRLRGAALGHLAAFEATSAVPSRQIATGIERVGLPEATAAYFHEHVEADSVHEQVAIRDICGSLVEGQPHLRDDVLFGAAACLHLDSVAATAVFAAWGLDDDGGRG